MLQRLTAHVRRLRVSNIRNLRHYVVWLSGLVRPLREYSIRTNRRKSVEKSWCPCIVWTFRMVSGQSLWAGSCVLSSDHLLSRPSEWKVFGGTEWSSSGPSEGGFFWLWTPNRVWLIDTLQTYLFFKFNCVFFLLWFLWFWGLTTNKCQKAVFYLCCHCFQIFFWKDKNQRKNT